VNDVQPQQDVRRIGADRPRSRPADTARSIAAGRLLQSLLFGMTPTDVRPFVAASAFLLAVAVVATLIPARRAMCVNPVEALRME
jgi:hypothetical protein